MKNLVRTLLLMIAFVASSCYSNGQKNAKTTTVIVVRHAEKDTGNNPSLTTAGMLRAEKLPAKFPGIKPDEIYSTPYIRTQQTATPWAKQLGVEIKTYDPKNLPEFAEMLKKETGKTILVIGHSNTNPQLVNLLVDDEQYGNLADSDYETIFYVTLTGKKSKVKVMKFNE